MSSQPKSKNNKKESDYSIINLVFTIAKESLKNVNETTHITIGETGSGKKFIRTELLEAKEKSTH